MRNKCPYETVHEFFKNTMFYPVIDVLTIEIESRLEEKSLDILNSLSIMQCTNKMDKDSVKFVCKYFMLDFEFCMSELVYLHI